MSTSLGSLIRAYRVRKGLSQAELAEKISVSQGAIGQWERGEFKPRGRHINSLSEALDLPADFFQMGATASSPTPTGETQAEKEQPSPEQEKSLLASRDPAVLLKSAEHQGKNAEFERNTLQLIAQFAADVRRHVAIDGPTAKHWIVDYLTHRSVIELKHPRSYATVESLATQTLWRLAVLRVIMGEERNYVALIRRPPDEHADADSKAHFEHRMAILGTEAYLAGIAFYLVDTPEQAAKAIEESEHELDRRYGRA